jgi:hypothetical protein
MIYRHPQGHHARLGVHYEANASLVKTTPGVQ